jgi:hypothetical protein
MNVERVCAVAFAVGLVASAASAQEAKTTYVLATYYRCNQATENRADAIYKETVAPLVQKQIDAGNLVASGWGRHWFGGEWRRLEYVMGTDLDKIVDARQAVITELMGTQKKAGDEFDAICPSHDDYIWASVASSQAPSAAGRERAKTSFSTYYVCDSREKEADAIVKTVFAPVMNTQVKDGKISSWNWLEHFAGGKYRRLLVIDGADHKSLLGYWSMVDKSLADAQPELAQRFTEICDSHTGYIWDLGTE